MNNTWKTGSTPPVPKSMQWPTLAQWGRQLGIILTLTLLWGGSLALFLQLMAAPTEEAQPPQNKAVASAPTPTETPLPTDTPTPEPSPTNTPEPPPMADPDSPDDSAPAAPLPTATHTPTSEPTATDTPVPPSPTPPPAELAPTEASTVSFANDVLPILENRCAKCHGGEETEEGLDLTNHADALTGSWNGSVIEPGNVAESYLIEQIESGEMPKDEPRLLPGEIRTITEWIAAGAPDN